MRFTPKESESPSAFTVAERNVCAAMMEQENCMFEAVGQAFAKASKTPTDARTVRTAVVAKMMVLQENFKPVFCGTDGAGEPSTWRRYCTGMKKGRGVGWLQGVACCRGALEFAHCCRGDLVMRLYWWVKVKE